MDTNRKLTDIQNSSAIKKLGLFEQIDQWIERYETVDYNWVDISELVLEMRTVITWSTATSSDSNNLVPKSTKHLPSKGKVNVTTKTVEITIGIKRNFIFQSLVSR